MPRADQEMMFPLLEYILRVLMVFYTLDALDRFFSPVFIAPQGLEEMSLRAKRLCAFLWL